LLSLAAAVNSTGLFADIDVVATLLVSTTRVPTLAYRR
jgi:hypothetical protein